MGGRPRVVFLDEPSTGLDRRSRAELCEMVHELRSEGTTILLTTQYLEEADQLAQRIAVIDQGKIVAQGTAWELKERVGRDRLILRIAVAMTRRGLVETERRPALLGRRARVDDRRPRRGARAGDARVAGRPDGRVRPVRRLALPGARLIPRAHLGVDP